MRRTVDVTGDKVSHRCNSQMQHKQLQLLMTFCASVNLCPVLWVCFCENVHVK